MEWTSIKYGGIWLKAADFLDGVMVKVPGPGVEDVIVFVQGWYVMAQRGDMDGPALRKRSKPHTDYRLVLKADE